MITSQLLKPWREEITRGEGPVLSSSYACYPSPQPPAMPTLFPATVQTLLSWWACFITAMPGSRTSFHFTRRSASNFGSYFSMHTRRLFTHNRYIPGSMLSWLRSCFSASLSTADLAKGEPLAYMISMVIPCRSSSFCFAISV